MAFLNQFTKEVGVTTLYAKVAIGSSGAPTLDTAASKGIASITRTSQGLYQLTLDQTYNSLLWCDIMMLGTTSRDLTMQLKAADTSSAKTIDFFVHAAASVTDPTSGDELRIVVVVKNSSV